MSQVPAPSSCAARLAGQAEPPVSTDLSLDDLLTQVVESARQIAEAEHATLAVVGPDGAVDRVVRAGSTSARAAVRLPAPGDRSWLVVPLRSDHSVQGTLEVGNPSSGTPIGAREEQVLALFAATAATVIANGRRYAESRRRQDWLQASAEVSHQLLGSTSDRSVLEQIAESVARLAEADTVQVVLPVPDQEDTLEFAVTRGPGAEQARGLRYPAAGSIAEQAMHSPDGLVLTGVQDRVRSYGDVRARLHITDLMAFPLPRSGGPRGCVVVCRSNSQPFTPAEVTMARAFTSQAALALELADARADRSRLDLLEDRERISRELQHDVLQQLFDTSLTMQSALAMTANGVARAQLGRAVATLDDSIRNIRSSIFGLPRSQTLLTSVASRALAIIAQFTPALGFAPSLQVVGALDTVVDQQLASELKAVLREALTVLAAHPTSHAATVQVSAGAAEVSLTVTDDSGVLGRTAPSAALLDLRRQAEHRRGGLDLDHGPEGGSLLRWSVPVPERPGPGQLC